MHQKKEIITWFEISNTKQGSHHKLLNSTSHQNKLSTQNCSAAPESLCRCCQLPALGVLSPHTIGWERTDSPGTGKFPRNQSCVKQAAGNLKTVQFKADLLHLLDQRQRINPFILPRRKPLVTMKGIPRRITNYMTYIIAEHFCNPHSVQQTKSLSQKPAFCTTPLFLGCFYRRSDLRWA